MFGITKWISFTVVSLILSGCGDSSATRIPTVNDTTVISGKFIDSAVEGLRYICDSGATDKFTKNDGTFTCNALPVAFYLGEIKLGNLSAVPSDGEVHIQDLVGVDRNDTSNSDVLKIATLLQSLDNDQNATNGINILRDTNDLFGDSLDIATLTLEELKMKIREKDDSIEFLSENEIKAHLNLTNGIKVTTPPATETNTTTPPVTETNTTTPPATETNTTTPPVTETNTTTPPATETNTTTPPVTETNTTIPPVIDTNITTPPVTETNTTVPVDTNTTPVTETNTTVPADTNTTPVTETNTTLPEGTVMYEDASEGNTSKWTTFNTDVNSTITNVYATDKQSNVIQVQTVGKTNAYYVLGEKNSGWADIDTNTIQWDMKVSNAFKITVYIRSANGLKQLKYSDSNTPSNGLAYGLGSVVKDGVWRSFERNIAVDLDKAEPGNTLVSINGFRIDFLSAGNISVDNIALLTTDEGTDVTPPTIIVKDGSEITVNQGSTYRAYATAQDSRDGNVAVTISGDTVSVDATTRVVDTATIGTYTITYTATDSTGNEATATQIIHVI